MQLHEPAALVVIDVQKGEVMGSGEEVGIPHMDGGHSAGAPGIARPIARHSAFSLQSS